MSGVILTSCSGTGKSNRKAGYSGNDISGQVSIHVDKISKDITFENQVPGSWTLYGGNSVDSINPDQAVLTGNGTGTFQVNRTDSGRMYFEVITPEGTAILAEKHLPIEGGYNFRDMGGIRTTDGKYVKWGKIFRSDDLHSLTRNDQKYLASIPIRSVVDFRFDQEVNAAPDKDPVTATHYSYSISPGNLMAVATQAQQTMPTANQTDSLMMELNRLLVTDTATIQRYVDFFRLLQNENNTPLLFHCSAGKDRTGMGAALILYSLGVDEQTIFQDYLLSNKYLADKYAAYKQQYPELSSLFEVKPEFLQAGLDQIKKDHGSVENYLTTILKVDLDRMKKIYLYE